MKRYPATAILTLCALLAATATLWGAAVPANPPAISAASAASAAPAAAAAPKAVVAEPVVDVGTVPKGDSINHDFVVKNEGAGPLEITQVQPSCGCTVASFDKTIASDRASTGGESMIMMRSQRRSASSM